MNMIEISQMTGRDGITLVTDEQSILASYAADESVRGLASAKHGFFVAKTDDKNVVGAVKLLNSLKTQLDASRPKSAEPLPGPTKLDLSQNKSRGSCSTTQPPVPQALGQRKWEISQKFPTVGRHSSGKSVSAPDTFKPLPLQEMTEVVSAVRSAASEREQNLAWLSYWGNLRHLQSEQANLTATVNSTTSDVARLTCDRDSLATQLSWAMGHVKDLESMLEHERQEAASALALEQSRHDSLASENDRLKNKVSEMRYQVTLAENALHKLRLESDAAQLAAANATAEVEQLKLHSSVEIMQLKKEILSATFSTEKQARLEHLEQEASRQAEQMATLFKTIDLVKADNKALHERLQASSMPVAAASRSGVTLDAGSIQQLAQKQFQKVEQELTELVATLRRENDKCANRTSGMKHFIEKGVRAFELDLMGANDVDSNTGVRFVPKTHQALVVKPRKGAGPPAPQYTTGPLIFPTPTNAHGLDSPAENLLGPVIAGLNEVMWKDVMSVWATCKEISEKLWAAVDKALPAHPQKNPAGEKEMVHSVVSAAIQKGYAVLQRAGNRLVELVKELLRLHSTRESVIAKLESDKSDLQRRVETLSNAPKAPDMSEALKSELASTKSAAASAAKMVENSLSNSKYCHERVTSCLRRCNDELSLPIDASNVQHVDDSFFERDVPPQLLEILRDVIFCVERHAEALVIQRAQMRQKPPSGASSPGAAKLTPEPLTHDSTDISLDLTLPTVAASDVTKQLEALTVQVSDLKNQNQELIRKLAQADAKVAQAVTAERQTPPPRAPSPTVTLIPQPYLVDGMLERTRQTRSVGVNTDAASRPSSPASRPTSSGHVRRAGSPARPSSPQPEQNVQLVVGSDAAGQKPTGHGPAGNREPLHSRAALQPVSLPVPPNLSESITSVEHNQRKVRSAAAVHRIRFTQAAVATTPVATRSTSPTARPQEKDFSFVPFLTTKRLM